MIARVASKPLSDWAKGANQIGQKQHKLLNLNFVGRCAVSMLLPNKETKLECTVKLISPK